MTNTINTLELSEYEYREKQLPYLFFRKSYSGNASTYKIRLDRAVDIYKKIFDERLIFVDILKHPTADKDAVYEKRKQTFYNRIKSRSTHAKQSWYHTSSDIYYTFEHHNPRHFLEFVEIYENIILPNYNTNEYYRLDEVNTNCFSKKRYVTIYEDINETLRDGIEYYDERENTLVRDIALFTLKLINEKHQSTHLEYTINKIEKLRSENRYLPITMNNTVFRISDDEVINSIVKEVLVCAIGAQQYRHYLMSAELLERIDIYDHKIFEAIADKLNIAYNPFTGTHRDIITDIKSND